MKMLSLFAGIGGVDLAAQWADIETCAFVEIDPFCQSILAKNFPNIPIFGDVHDVTAESLERAGIGHIDIIAGGFPCQPVSQAGKRKAQADPRWLWPEMARLIRDLRPSWVVGENVYGLVSKGLDDVLSDLEDLRYTCWPLVYPASAVGAPHQRERIFIVAHANDIGPERRAEVGRQEKRGIEYAGNPAMADAPRMLRCGATQGNSGLTVGSGSAMAHT